MTILEEKEGIRLYLGLASESTWDRGPIAPGKYVCLSPVIGKTEKSKRENFIKLPEDPDLEIIQDSGAFCDSWPSGRLSFEEALQRQRNHADKFEYTDRITHRASYDLLIDEVWDENHTRVKRRWTREQAEEAVDLTVQAAKFSDLNRDPGIACVQSAQGVTTDQYVNCVKQVLPFIKEGDILGLGGWCVLGKFKRQMMPTYDQTISQVIPLAKEAGIPRVHIWGVIFPVGLGKLLWLGDYFDIQISTDSAGPSFRPNFGEWGYGSWRVKDYKRVPAAERTDERKRHVQETRDHLNNLRNYSEYYKKPDNFKEEGTK